MHHGTKTSLALDDGVGHTHLPAQSWKEDDELDGIHIIGDQHQRGLLGLNERHHMVQTILDSVWLLADIFFLLALRDRSSLLVQTLLLLLLRLRSVLAEQLEDLRCRVAVESVRELRDGRWNFEAHVEDLALALQAHVFGPSHHAGEVALRLDVLADSEVAWAALEEGILVSSIHTSTCHRDVRRTHLVGILLARATRLAGWEWRRSGLLARFWRLSLRRTVSHCSFSREFAHSTMASVAAQAISSPAALQSAIVVFGSLLQHARRGNHERSRGVQIYHLLSACMLTIVLDC